MECLLRSARATSEGASAATESWFEAFYQSLNQTSLEAQAWGLASISGLSSPVVYVCARGENQLSVCVFCVCCTHHRGAGARNVNDKSTDMSLPRQSRAASPSC